MSVIVNLDSKIFLVVWMYFWGGTLEKGQKACPNGN